MKDLDQKLTPSGTKLLVKALAELKRIAEQCDDSKQTVLAEMCDGPTDGRSDAGYWTGVLDGIAATFNMRAVDLIEKISD